MLMTSRSSHRRCDFQRFDLNTEGLEEDKCRRGHGLRRLIAHGAWEKSVRATIPLQFLHNRVVLVLEDGGQRAQRRRVFHTPLRLPRCDVHHH